MDRFFIAQGDNSDNLAVKLVNFAPKAITVISLFLYLYRLFNHLNTRKKAVSDQKSGNSLH
jgi:hypothetical protein